MQNTKNGRLTQGNRTVGHVKITAPAGADDHSLATQGPSFLGTSFLTALDVGILLTDFTTDPDVTGTYEIEIRLNNGNTQSLYVTAT